MTLINPNKKSIITLCLPFQNSFYLLAQDDFCLKIGVWYPGNDIALEGGTFIRWDYNLVECIDLCQEESECVGIEFNPDYDGRTKCYFKTKMEASDESRPLIAWHKDCPGIPLLLIITHTAHPFI